MKLSDIIQVCDVLSVRGNPDVEITGLTNDSRRVGPGSLFIAVTGCGGKPVCTSARNYYIGDSDWMAQSAEFTYDPKGKALDPSVDFTFYVADGTFWVEGLNVEEVKEKEE